MAEPYDPSIKLVLPHERIYTLRIGSETFHVSGASLSSDSPSYFTNFFLNEENKDKVLIIDRSSEIFKLILQHLQGYYLEIPNADVFTRLFNDVLYYNLPQLMKNMTINNEYYYVIIETEYMKIPRKLMNNPASGNYPNFFSVANESLYKDISTLMMSQSWIRPPPQAAPSLARSAQLLKDLVSLLENAGVEIRSKEYRRSLIKEAKYYGFNGLVHTLIDHRIVFNPLTDDEEIVIPLTYIEHKYIKFQKEEENSNYFQLYYQRPYNVDCKPRLLNFQIESNNEIILDPASNTVIFKNHTLFTLTKILGQLLSSKNGYNSNIFKSCDELKVKLFQNGESSIKLGDQIIPDISSLNETKDAILNKKRKLEKAQEHTNSKDQRNWVVKSGIFQFYYFPESDCLKTQLLKGDIYSNGQQSFYSNLEFL